MCIRDRHAVLATRCEPFVLTEVPQPSAGRTIAGRRARLRKRAVQGVVVVEVAGRLGDVVEDLDRVIQLILAEEPRGVVCDLSGVFEGAESRPRLECWRQQGGMFATGPGSPWPWPARTRGSAKPCAPTPWVVA